MCGATEGGLSLDGVNVAKEAVIQGQVLRGDEPVGNAYVRLLDRTGEFTAEVPTSATGHFRFFAGEGEWTLRTLAPQAEPVDNAVHAAGRLRRRGDRRALTRRSRERPSPEAGALGDEQVCPSDPSRANGRYNCVVGDTREFALRGEPGNVGSLPSRALCLSRDGAGAPGGSPEHGR